MQIQVALAAAKKLIPTGHTMAGYEIQKDGSPLLTLGGKHTQKAIMSSVEDYTKRVGDIHLVIWIRDKNGDMTTTKTLYSWDGSEAIAH